MTFVGAGGQRLRHGEAECLRGLQVDDEFEHRRLLGRQIAGVGALQYAVDLRRSSDAGDRFEDGLSHHIEDRDAKNAGLCTSPHRARPR
jgi:hypothetical protein